MNIIKDQLATAKRPRRVIVELLPDEKLMSFVGDDYYRLGGQVNDIVRGNVITESCPVYWCSISQTWET